MPPKDRRLREREETRAKIIDAAREMFASDGVEAVTMRAIANRIEYTPTAIYHHFRDKQALLQELCARDYGSLAKTFVRIGRIEDPIERLRRIGLGYLDFALEHPSHYRFMFMTRKPDGFSDAIGLQRGWLDLAFEAAGALLLAWMWRRCDLADPERREALLRHGLLMQPAP